MVKQVVYDEFMKEIRTVKYSFNTKSTANYGVQLAVPPSIKNNYNNHHFILPQATLYSYKNSFYPRTIKDWKNLPISIIEARDIDEFTYLLNLNYCNY